MSDCRQCGRSWDDTLFALACGCNLTGHSECHAAQIVRAGGSASLHCAAHGWQSIRAMSTA